MHTQIEFPTLPYNHGHSGQKNGLSTYKLSEFDLHSLEENMESCQVLFTALSFYFPFF